MKLQQETLGRLSIGFAVCGLVLPFILGFVNAVLSPGQSGESPYLGLLFLLLQLTAIVCAIAARGTQAGRIGLGVAIGSLCLLVGLAAFFAYHRTQDPRNQALAFYRALHDQNWRAMWELTSFTPMERRVWRTPEIYERDMRQNLEYPDVREAFGYFTQLQDISVGDPRFNPGGAEVPTSATLPYHGRLLHLHGVAHLREEDGTWKVVISESDTDDPYRALCQLIGIPYHRQSR